MVIRNAAWWLPAASFGLALLLAALTGPAGVAMGLRSPAQATPCRCIAKVETVSATLDWVRRTADGLPEPNGDLNPKDEPTKFDVTINATIFHEAQKDLKAGGLVKASAFVQMQSDFMKGGELKTQQVDIKVDKEKEHNAADALQCPGNNDFKPSFKDSFNFNTWKHRAQAMIPGRPRVLSLRIPGQFVGFSVEAFAKCGSVTSLKNKCSGKIDLTTGADSMPGAGLEGRNGSTGSGDCGAGTPGVRGC